MPARGLAMALTGVLALATAGCSSRASLQSCRDDLRGVWVAPGGAHWMMLDSGATLEAYPMADDAVPPPATPAGVVFAPRVLDLHRTGAELGGEMKRRIMRRADTCEARAPVHVTRCTGDTLELVLADPPAPLAFAPCRWPAPSPSRVERWRRE